MKEKRKRHYVPQTSKEERDSISFRLWLLSAIIVLALLYFGNLPL